MLASLDEAVREARLVRRYYTRQGFLHRHCFYIGTMKFCKTSRLRNRP